MAASHEAPPPGPGRLGTLLSALVIAALCAAGVVRARARSRVAALDPPGSPHDEAAAQVVEPLRRAEAAAESARLAVASYRAPEASGAEPSSDAPPRASEPEPRTAAAAASEPARVSMPAWREGARGFEDALSDRKRLGTPMAVFFYTTWCGYCRRMDRSLLPSPEVAAYLDGLAKVRVDPETGEAERALAQKFGVRGFPSFFIVSSDGGSVRKIHPFFRTDRGWEQMSPGDFVAACRKAE